MTLCATVGFLHDASLQVLKLSTFVLLLLTTALSAASAKATFLLMTGGFGHGGQNVSICADKIPGEHFLLPPPPHPLPGPSALLPTAQTHTLPTFGRKKLVLNRGL